MNVQAQWCQTFKNAKKTFLIKKIPYFTMLATKSIWKLKILRSNTTWAKQTCWGWIPLISPLVTPPSNTKFVNSGLKLPRALSMCSNMRGSGRPSPQLCLGPPSSGCFLVSWAVLGTWLCPTLVWAYFGHLVYRNHPGMCLTSPRPAPSFPKMWAAQGQGLSLIIFVSTVYQLLKG